MKRELGIARCGLACCLCSENVKCNGCSSDKFPCYIQCENRKFSIEKGQSGCYACKMDCKRGLLSKIKPYGFTLFIKRYGMQKLLNYLEENEKKGIVYHREGIIGDYDDFDDVERLIEFVMNGKR